MTNALLLADTMQVPTSVTMVLVLTLVGFSVAFVFGLFWWLSGANTAVAAK